MSKAGQIEEPIALSPKGSIDRTARIVDKAQYRIDFAFSREGVTFERLQELIGASRACKIGSPCPPGVVVPVRWSVLHVDTGNIVGSGVRDTFEATGWTAADVYRTIGTFNADRGTYQIKVEIMRNVPELATLQTRIVVYQPTK